MGVNLGKRVLRHRLTKNTLALLAIQIVNYAVPLVLLVHLADALGVERYGVVAVAIAITQLGQILIDAGFLLSATALIAKRRARPRLVGRLVAAIVASKLIIYVLVALFIVTFAATTTKYADHRALILLTLIPLLGTTLVPAWLFQGLERMEFLSALTLLTKLGYGLLVLVSVNGPADYLWILASDGLMQIAAAATALLIMRHLGIPVARPKVREIRFALRMTAPFFASRVAVTAYQGSGTLVLGALVGPVAAATYALADQFYRALQQVFVPFVQALYPYMASERDLRLMVMSNVVGVVLAFIGALTMSWIGPWLVGHFFSAAWASALPIIDVFLFAIVIHVMAVMSGYPLAVAVGRLDVANRSVIYGALVFSAGMLCLWLGDIVTGRSVAAMMIVAEAYVFLHRALLLWPLVAAKLNQQPSQGAST